MASVIVGIAKPALNFGWTSGALPEISGQPTIRLAESRRSHCAIRMQQRPTPRAFPNTICPESRQKFLIRNPIFAKKLQWQVIWEGTALLPTGKAVAKDYDSSPDYGCNTIATGWAQGVTVAHALNAGPYSPPRSPDGDLLAWPHPAMVPD
jgi:hypothetical protein